MSIDPALVLRAEDVIPDPGVLPDADVTVAVIAQLTLPGQDEETYGLLKRFTTTTLESLRDAGVRTELIDVTAEEEPDYEAIRGADGLVVLGGGDVHPEFYGLEGEVPHAYGVDRRSDERQLRIIREAWEQDASLLAICRGSQLLNVARGGTLIPHLGDNTPHQGGPGEPMFLDEPIRLEQDSLVRDIFDRDEITVRSGHHQAVDRVGEGLRVAARALDGTVEGTEAVDRTWILGLQWHPEDSDGSAEDRAALIERFVANVRSRAAG